MGCHKGVKMHKYTPEQHQFIVDHTEGITAPELAKMFNERFGTDIKGSAINSYRCRYGLKCGVDCTFRKGSVPANKGLTWDEYMSKEGQEKSKKTCFKKGSIPPNFKPQWSTRITKDGYVEIKTEEHMKKWVLRSRYVWEQHHGKIPKGMVVFHLNGDSTDDRIENLILMSKSEMARLNQDGLVTTDAEINQCAVNIAKLKGKITSRRKGRS